MDVNRLLLNRRPASSIIKLIECVGILLSIPLTKHKSTYKAQIPSNYDDTLRFVADKFDDVILRLSFLESADIDTEIASSFYDKTLEPGFDYEDAVNHGGLLIRELFNGVLLVLLRLQSDLDRVPVVMDNVLLAMSGSRSSVIAFDFAAHILRHGHLNISVDVTLAETKQVTLLKSDLLRRCRLQYKIPEHRYTLHDLEPSPSNLEATQELQSKQNCTILVIGLQRPDFFGCPPPRADPLLEWALSREYQGDVVLTQTLSFVRPFAEVDHPRTYLLYLPHNLDPKSVFLKAIRFCRPGDALCVVTIFPSRQPLGDNHELRFDFGHRQGWLHNAKVSGPESTTVGWNDGLVEEFQNNLDLMLQKSFVTGRVRVEREPDVGEYSTAQILTQIASQENCASVVLKYAGNEDAVRCIVQDSTFAVILLK